MAPPLEALTKLVPENQPRTRATVLLVTADRSTLLLRGGDPMRPEAGTWWFPPGGGVEPGESLDVAARRELREETGLVVDDVGEVVHVRTTTFTFLGTTYDSTEHVFVVRCDQFEPTNAEWTALEHDVLSEWRWWSVDMLRSTSEAVYPEDLVETLLRLPE